MSEAEKDTPLPTSRFSDESQKNWQEPPPAYDWARALILGEEITAALVGKTSIPALLQHGSEALVKFLDVAFVRVWVLDKEKQELVLQASAGIYTHLNGAHSRIPLGAYKIGRIAAERRPHLTNDVLHDPQVSDHEWARHEGMVAFAGYPLQVEEQLFGVMALFSRHALSADALSVMATTANMLAAGIALKRVDQEREHLLILAQEACIQAETALALRNTFLSNVTHDLKAPLTTIKTSNQLLQRRLRNSLLSSQEIAPMLQSSDVIDASTRKMATMIDDLLDISLLQAGQPLTMLSDPLDLVAIVRQVVREQQVTTSQHRLEIDALINTLPIFGDQNRIERLITNLITNAIKYSPGGGTIKVCLKRERTPAGFWAVLSVQDQGLGIPSPDLPHIFEPFRRAANHGKQIKGTGIGLSSVKHTVHKHGGCIQVFSQVGRGSTFLIYLPLQPQVDEKEL